MTNEKLATALVAWAEWYSAKLDRINRRKDHNEGYSGAEDDLFQALGCTADEYTIGELVK